MRSPPDPDEVTGVAGPELRRHKLNGGGGQVRGGHEGRPSARIVLPCQSSRTPGERGWHRIRLYRRRVIGAPIGQHESRWADAAQLAVGQCG